MKFINDNNEVIELTRLKTITQYAAMIGINYSTAQYKVLRKQVDTVEIGGSIFVIEPKEGFEKPKRKMARVVESEG